MWSTIKSCTPAYSKGTGSSSVASMRRTCCVVLATFILQKFWKLCSPTRRCAASRIAATSSCRAPARNESHELGGVSMHCRHLRAGCQNAWRRASVSTRTTSAAMAIFERS